MPVPPGPAPPSRPIAYRGVVPLVVYSAQRLALFLGALLVLFWAHVGGWLLVVLAAVIAWALSYVLLPRSRDAAALWLASRVERSRTGSARWTRTPPRRTPRSTRSRGVRRPGPAPSRTP